MVFDSSLSIVGNFNGNVTEGRIHRGPELQVTYNSNSHLGLTG